MANQDFLSSSEIRDLEPGRIPLVAPHFASSESHHRIANNLAILSSAVGLQAAEVSRRRRHLSHEEVSAILGGVSSKITAIAWLHRFLSEEPAAQCLEFNDHLYRLCESLLSALSGRERARLVRIGAGECFVAVRDVVPLCLIVTEVVTNSIKYAHPANVAGVIFVGCREETDGSFMLEVADDGVGFPEGFDFAADGGTGARTIRALARQLDAQMSYESRDIGLLFKLRLPSRRGPICPEINHSVPA